MDEVEDGGPMKQPKIGAGVDYGAGLSEGVLENIFRLGAPLSVCSRVHPVWRAVARRLPGCLLGLVDTHDEVNAARRMPFLRKRSKVVEVVAAQDLIFALTRTGVCAVFSRGEFAWPPCRCLSAIPD